MMICHLKVLGLVLAMAFSLNGVVSTTAWAQQGSLTSDGPVTLRMTEGKADPNENTLTAFGREVECLDSYYTGHKYNITPHEPIPSGSTQFTVTPHYNQPACFTYPKEMPATVDVNGCDYVFRIGETTPPGNNEGTYGLTTDIICPEGQEIVITLFTSGIKHKEEKAFCAFYIKQQLALKGAHATDTKNGHIDVRGTVEGVHVTSKNLGEDPFLCQNQTTTTGKFDINVTVEGRSGGGGTTKVSISD